MVFSPHQYQHIVFTIFIIPILFSERIILLYSDISSNGYRFITRAPETEASFHITFDPPFNIPPCAEFVSAGNGSQGAAVRNVGKHIISIETFHMHSPNLIHTGDISVTVRATGEYVRILQYLRLLPREMCCTGGYMHE